VPSELWKAHCGFYNTHPQGTGKRLPYLVSYRMRPNVYPVAWYETVCPTLP